MKAFSYRRAASADEAVAMVAAQPGSRFIAGGTNLLDLMKLQIETPAHLVDINRVGLDRVEPASEGGLRIGALVRNSDLAADRRVREGYPLLSRALLSGASGQLRNKATTAGNLLQRVRCPYFYDTTQACNKRQPGSGCAAIGGVSRGHAIQGTSDQCIAVHPPDMAVALRALDASVETLASGGVRRSIPIADFHRLPGTTPQRENALAAGELITSVTLPAPIGGSQLYRKVRDRASYAFAMLSVAAVVVRDGPRVSRARLAFGGVGTVPWRVEAAEQALQDGAGAEAAAEQALAGSRTTADNVFKRVLLRRTLAATLAQTLPGARS
jgi:xanthine dehydrogenase YagS FAD-binding subunit